MLREKGGFIVFLGFVVCLILSVEPTVAFHEPTQPTPLKSTTVVFEPYFFDGGDCGSSDVIDASNLHGYSVTVYREEVVSLNPVNCTLLQFYNICVGGDYGIVFIVTHGCQGGIAVEAYEFTEEGKNARDAKYDYYLEQGFTTKEIRKAQSSDSSGYNIMVQPYALESWFVDANTIVYLVSCYTSYFSYCWGAREVLTYSGVVGAEKAKFDANLFWGHMDGTINKVTKRTVSKAIEGTRLHHVGCGNTVLYEVWYICQDLVDDPMLMRRYHIIPYDLDLDDSNLIDVYDIGCVAMAWQTSEGDENWNSSVDYREDGIINISDITTMAIHYLKVVYEVESWTEIL